MFEKCAGGAGVHRTFFISRRNWISRLPLIDEGGGVNCSIADVDTLLSLTERVVVQFIRVYVVEMTNAINR